MHIQLKPVFWAFHFLFCIMLCKDNERKRFWLKTINETKEDKHKHITTLKPVKKFSETCHFEKLVNIAKQTSLTKGFFIYQLTFFVKCGPDIVQNYKRKGQLNREKRSNQIIIKMIAILKEVITIWSLSEITNSVISMEQKTTLLNKFTSFLSKFGRSRFNERLT